MLSDQLMRSILFVESRIDIIWITSIGGDWTLHTEYCNAILRATILEGELYILTIGEGKEKKIASWVSWFPPGSSLFSTQVSCTFVDSFLKFDKATILKLAVTLSGLWDTTIFSKNLNLKYRTGYGILSVSL